MGLVISRNPTTNEIYKDYESDIVIVLIDESNDIFNSLAKKKYTAIWQEKNIKIKIGKYSFNNQNFIIINMPKNIDLITEFIVFYNPYIVILPTNIDDLSNIIECTNFVILYDVKNNKNNNNKFMDYININCDNFITNLKKKIDNNCFENLYNYKINYSSEIEKSISIINDHLSKFIKYKHLRYLSINLLLDDKICNLIKFYLDYDISSNNEFINIIKTERSKFNFLKKQIDISRKMNIARDYDIMS